MKHLVLPLLILGCAEPIEHAQVEQALGCSYIWCGMNSSKLGDIYTHEFRLDGEPTDAGFSIAKVVKENEIYQLVVENGQFVLHGETTTLTDEDVNGAMITVNHVDGSEYWIHIGNSQLTPYWVNAAAELRTYELSWTRLQGGSPKGEWQNVCTNPPDKTVDTFAMNGHSAVVFEGDRIDGATKTVGDPDTNYFNIGCAGHALAKMALTGHSYPGVKPASIKTTVEQRQTFLKMVTADYCGDGTPFTVPGTSLDWASEQAWLPYFYAEGRLEARWTKAGVSCIDTLRLEPKNPTGGGIFPGGVLEAVDDHCGLPPQCQNAEREIFDGHYLVSAIPY
jgi:hypothetical protein